VPLDLGSFQTFIDNFGNTDGKKFGPIAVNEWMRNAASVVYVRILGAGDGKKRSATDGAVTNAGFTVGQQLPQANGIIGSNAYAATADPSAGTLGRTFFLGCFMSQSAGSTIFSDAGITELGTTGSHPIIRGVLFTPSGVVASLSSSLVPNNLPSTTVAGKVFGVGDMGGANLGDVITGSLGSDSFTMILNGHKQTTGYDNVITSSFDPWSDIYFARIFNTDPRAIELAGHCLYTHYDIHPAYAVITGSGIGDTDGMPIRTGHAVDEGQGHERSTLGFLLTGSMPRATSAASTTSNVGVSDFESFTDRFTTARSPFVISQRIRGQNKNLFRVHAISAGSGSNTEFKVTIENIRAKTPTTRFGTFDLVVREFNDADRSTTAAPLDTFTGLDLNPSSDKYITKVIGDANIFYDFDKKPGSQKVVVEGTQANISRYIRIEESDDLRRGRLDITTIPVGFRGMPHLVTSGTSTPHASILTGSFPTSAIASTVGITTDELSRCVQLPIPFREHIANQKSKQFEENEVVKGLTWGVQFEQKTLLEEPNREHKIDASIASFVKYFPNFHTTNQNPIVDANEGTLDIAGSVLDADRFNNNLFTLERVQVITGTDGVVDSTKWASAKYSRNGVLAPSASFISPEGHLDDPASDAADPKGWGIRFLDPNKDFADDNNKDHLNFTFPVYGGFDGLNIFDEDKFNMTDAAVRREMADRTNEFGVNSATVASVRKAIDIMAEKADVDIQLLVTPGFRHENITDYAIDAVERRFDALYIMDIEEKDDTATFVTSSAQIVGLSDTISRFKGRSLDSSFAAAYFPDVFIRDLETNTDVRCPPSVAVLGAYALNDALGAPWFAPAGFSRGHLETVTETQVKLKDSNLDDLYSADINSLISRDGGPGVVIFGQKTLKAAAGSLDRINVRRLLINIRRQVRVIARDTLFPDTSLSETLANFSAAVTPLLSQIQQRRGLQGFRVMIDTSTTTQADVENYTIRGKILLQPARSGEFVSLDFLTGFGDV
jgi:phage tail sheath protein FI